MGSNALSYTPVFHCSMRHHPFQALGPRSFLDSASFSLRHSFDRNLRAFCGRQAQRLLYSTAVCGADPM